VRDEELEKARVALLEQQGLLAESAATFQLLQKSSAQYFNDARITLEEHLLGISMADSASACGDPAQLSLVAGSTALLDEIKAVQAESMSTSSKQAVPHTSTKQVATSKQLSTSTYEGEPQHSLKSLELSQHLVQRLNTWLQSVLKLHRDVRFAAQNDHHELSEQLRSTVERSRKEAEVCW
jgi:hypothetical protein